MAMSAITNGSEAEGVRNYPRSMPAATQSRRGDDAPGNMSPPNESHLPPQSSPENSGPSSVQQSSPPSAVPRASSHRPLPLMFAGPPSNATGSSNQDDPPRLTRKRAAPLHLVVERTRGNDDVETTNAGGRPRDSDDRNNGIRVEALPPDALEAASQRDSICLCTPAPKVPRPRNAFILFRQHYQSQVVGQNPGLANPDISKIIGMMWKEQSEEVKEYWKNLAEQEKIRHRRQYPDYRYQPRRGGKGDPMPGGRSNSTGDSKFDGEAECRDGDPSRCPKCGGRYISTPRTPSTPRLLPGSAKQPNLPPSAFNIINGSHSVPKSNDFELDRRGSAYTSPKSAQYLPPPTNSYHGDLSRRPLPYHGHRNALCISQNGEVNGTKDSHYGDGLPTPSDQKRRRYDDPTPSSARFPSRTTDSGVRGGARSYSAYGYSQNQADREPPLPQTPGLISLAQNLTSSPSLSSPWMGPPLRPPLPEEHSANYRLKSHTSLPPCHGRAFPERREQGVPDADSQVPHHQTNGLPPGDTGDAMERRGYADLPARLPPPNGAYGFYQPSSGSAGVPTSSAHAPSPASPPSLRAMAYRIGGTDGVQQQHQCNFDDASLKLPPLQTHVLAGAHSPTLSDSSSRDGGRFDSLLDAVPHASEMIDKVSGSNSSSNAKPGLTKERHASVSPTLISEGCTGKDSQESGVRVMVMSVPYLNKLEVLRRISPPQPLSPKRGPIIAIEGHNAALITVVGRAVQNALVQSDECRLRVWSRIVREGSGASVITGDEDDDTRMHLESRGEGAFAKKNSTDSGVGSSIESAAASTAPSPGSDYDSTTKNESANPLLSYHQFIMSWHTKSQEIIKHVTAKSTTADESSMPMVTAPASVALQPGLTSAHTPTSSMPAPPLPTSPARSPGSLSQQRKSSASPSCSPSPELSPRLSSAARAESSSPLLPVALITGGYSLALSDQYAMSVPIDDSFPPISHWEWMATLWRGIAGPDLVVYADPRPPQETESTVNTRTQEGVIVVHVPPQTRGDRDTSRNSDSSDDLLIDKKTERRLAFEVIEWIRAGNFEST